MFGKKCQALPVLSEFSTVMYVGSPEGYSLLTDRGVVEELHSAGITDSEIDDMPRRIALSLEASAKLVEIAAPRLNTDKT